MGPRHHRRGSQRRGERAYRGKPSFNGAATSSSRIGSDKVGGGKGQAGFNGAATSSSRIVTLPMVTPSVVRVLQWGRDIIVADRRCTRPRFPSAARASMGPRHHRRGSLTQARFVCALDGRFNGAATSSSRIVRSSRGEELNLLELQWGRDIIVADRSSKMQRARLPNTLQWGRDIIVADRALRIRWLNRLHRFNGAATSSSRIEQSPIYSATNYYRFNGAATSSSRIA